MLTVLWFLAGWTAVSFATAALWAAWNTYLRRRNRLR